MDAARALRDYLTGAGPRPDVKTLVRHRLAGYGYLQPADGETDLQRAYVAAVATHMSTKAKVAPLLQAWSDAGIDFVLFKGLYFADAVYPNSGSRVYADVDVCVAQPDLQRARTIAKDSGWYESWHREDSLWENKHEESVLERGGVTLELHRLMVHASTSNIKRQRQLTQAFMVAAVPLELSGIEVKVPQPVDSALLLIIARCWSGEDHWRVRAVDFLDLKYLVANSGVTREQLESRARELGCSQTVRVFLRRCDPWGRVLHLDAPTAAQRHWWNLLATPDHGNLTLTRSAMYLSRAFGVGRDALRELPVAWRVRCILAAPGAMTSDSLPDELESLCRATDGEPPANLSNRELARVVRGITAASSLLWRTADPCLPHAVGAWLSLRERRVPARLNLERDTETGAWHASADVPGKVDGRSALLVRCLAGGRITSAERRRIGC